MWVGNGVGGRIGLSRRSYISPFAVGRHNLLDMYVNMWVEIV